MQAPDRALVPDGPGEDFLRYAGDRVHLWEVLRVRITMHRWRSPDGIVVFDAADLSAESNLWAGFLAASLWTTAAGTRWRSMVKCG